MKKLTLFSLLITFVILLLPFGAVSEANAGIPVKNEETFEYYFDIPNPCGFPITGHTIGTVKTTFYFSDNDYKNRVFDNIIMKYTWSANGKEINMQNGAPNHFYQIDNGYIKILVGALDLITIPGYGVVSGSAGQLILTFQWNEELQYYVVTDMAEIGKPTFTDWAPICEYLGE